MHPTNRHPRHHRLRARWHALLAAPEAGEATISSVILWPVMLLLVWLVIQGALLFFGRTLALSAAEQGAQAARLRPVSTARAQTAAQDFLTAAGTGLVFNPQVKATTDTTSIRVEVTATAVSLIPGLPLRIHQESVQPLEQLRR